MSESHRRPGRWRGRRVDPHTLAGAYAMDAVTDEDRARFEQHLADCETCLADLRGMRETTARLAAAAEVRPRAELREQTVRAAAQTRQLPPVTPVGPARPGGRWRRGLAPAAGTPWGRGWLPRIAIGVA